MDDLTSAGDDKELVEIKLVPPPVKIMIKRIKKLHQLNENKLRDRIDLEIDKIDYENYKIKRTVRNIKNISDSTKLEEVTDYERREFSEFTLIAETARYLYHPEGVDHLSKISCLEIKKVLESSTDGIEKVLKVVNKHNEVLYDWVIPRLFNAFYTIKSYIDEVEEEIELVKVPKEGFYRMKAKSELIANIDDPESHIVRSYYPDFLVKVKTDDGSKRYIIIEVKGDNKIDDEVVMAKADYATQLADASGLTYQIIKGSEANNGIVVE